MKINLKENLTKLRQKKISISIGTLTIILMLMVMANIGGFGNIVQAATAPVAPVINALVVNTAANPVPIVDTENPARQPFQFSGSASINEGDILGSTSFNVPSGKELVIEFVSVQGTLSSGQKIEYSVATKVNGTPAEYKLIPNFIGTFTVSGVDVDRIDASQQLRLYADPGSTVFLSALRNSNTNAGSIFFSVSGYLVNKT